LKLNFRKLIFKYDDFDLQFLCTVLPMKLPPWIVCGNMLLSKALKENAAAGNIEGVLSELETGRCHINAADEVSTNA